MRTPTGIPANESVFKFDIHAVGLTTRKRRGEAAEAAFLAKASGPGLRRRQALGRQRALRLSPRLRTRPFLARSGQIHPALRRVALSRQSRRMEGHLHSRRNRFPRRLDHPRKFVVRRPHSRFRLTQEPSLLSPRRTQSALRKISRGLVPDGLPSLRTNRARANRTRLRQPEPGPRLLPLRATLRPLCRLPPLPPAHLIPSCHSESASAVRNLLLSLQPSLRGVPVSRHSCGLAFPP